MNTFWDFCLATYKREGVQASVIALQNAHGLDVNLLFFCCWLAVTGRGQLKSSELRKADGAIEAWRRQVTLPLRASRDAIKSSSELWSLSGAAEVRNRVLAAEIDSEHVSVKILEQLAPTANQTEKESSRLADAVTNLHTYFEMLGVNLDDRARADLSYLVHASFPTSSETLVTELLKAQARALNT